jgi:hypothetical protein
MLEKCDHLIEFLSSIKAVKENEATLAKLPSFKDLPWIIGYCKDTLNDWKQNPERHLSNLILACVLKDSDFTKEERERFASYLSMFMEVTENIFMK